MTDFLFLDSKITADGNYSHEIRRRLLLGSKVMSLLFNTLSRFVIAFLPRSNHLLILWLQSPSTVILESKKRKSVTVSPPFPLYLPWSDGAGCPVLAFLILSFKLALSLSSFTLIMRPFSSSLLYVIRVVSSTYLRLLIFLLPILIPTCNSAYRLKNESREHCHTPFSIWNQSVVPHKALTVASWPT